MLLLNLCIVALQLTYMYNIHFSIASFQTYNNSQPDSVPTYLNFNGVIYSIYVVNSDNFTSFFFCLSFFNFLINFLKHSNLLLLPCLAYRVKLSYLKMHLFPFTHTHKPDHSFFCLRISVIT